MQPVVLLTLGFLVAILVAGTFAFRLERRVNPDLTIDRFLRRTDKPLMAVLLPGLMFGATFGFVDNLGMVLGVDTIKDLLPASMSIATKAGIANVYSGVFGIGLSTFIGILMEDRFRFSMDEVPIWVNIVGMVLGGGAGIVLGGGIARGLGLAVGR